MLNMISLPSQARDKRRESAQKGETVVYKVRTPLGKTSASDDRNFWTLIFDTETFSGPLGYYLPEFFAER